MENETSQAVKITPEKTSSTKKGKVIFWSRMAGWVLTGVIAPIVTFAIKFGLFTETGYTITVDELGNITASTTALNGWGILSSLLVAFAVFQVVKEVIAAQGTGYSYPKQLLQGLKSRILPIAIALGVAYFLQGVIDQIVFCLVVLLITQAAALAINPLPEWRAKKNQEEDYSDIISGLAKAIKERAKKRGVK
jgi:hypothetical protein